MWLQYKFWCSRNVNNADSIVTVIVPKLSITTTSHRHVISNSKPINKIAIFDPIIASSPISAQTHNGTQTAPTRSIIDQRYDLLGVVPSALSPIQQIHHRKPLTTVITGARRYPGSLALTFLLRSYSDSMAETAEEDCRARDQKVPLCSVHGTSSTNQHNSVRSRTITLLHCPIFTTARLLRPQAFTRLLKPCAPPLGLKRAPLVAGVETRQGRVRLPGIRICDDVSSGWTRGGGFRTLMGHLSLKFRNLFFIL